MSPAASTQSGKPPADRPGVDAEIRAAAERHRAGGQIVVRGTSWIAAGRK